MKLSSISKALFVCLLMISAIMVGKNANAIGQITTPIEIVNLLRGQSAHEKLIFFNSLDRPVPVLIQAEGEIEKWTTFYESIPTDDASPITEMTLPSDGNVTVYGLFTVPGDTPNGEYAGKVIIVTNPDKKEDSEETVVTIKQRIARQVTITVTDKEIIDLKVSVIPKNYGPAKDQPLIINLSYVNNGNVVVQPDAELKITRVDSGINVLTAIFPYPESEEPVKPLEKKVIPVEWQTAGQEKGKYRASLNISLNDEIVHSDEFVFNAGGGIILGASNESFLGRFAPTIIVIIVGILIVAVNYILKRKQSKIAPKK